jgi:hypothetical protein
LERVEELTEERGGAQDVLELSTRIGAVWHFGSFRFESCKCLVMLHLYDFRAAPIFYLSSHFLVPNHSSSPFRLRSSPGFRRIRAVESWRRADV